MNIYKFGNYICKLREDKNLTQAELARIIDVSDKSISKWENGQAFPRIETFEKLAKALDTTVEDIFSASKDGIKRICVVNNFYSLMRIDVCGMPSLIGYNEGKWIEINDKARCIEIYITGEFSNDDIFGDVYKDEATIKDRLFNKFLKKATTGLMDIILQVDCTYKISDICYDAFITVEPDGFDLGDKMLTMEDFQIMYPKIICSGGIKAELIKAVGKNKDEVIKRYQKLGIASDVGLDFITMLLSYPIRGMYFKHLCKPSVLKKNILKAEEHKKNTEKRNNISKRGCMVGCLSIVVLSILCFALQIFVLPVIFVEISKPYLVSQDYSKITYEDKVYIRIDELPDNAYPEKIFFATVWEDTRTEGLSKLEQSMQDDKVQLLKDDNGGEYLWLVEDYADTILGTGDDGEDLDYEDFDTHYVYVLVKP